MTSFLADQNERLRLSTNGSSSRFPGSPHPAVATVAYSPPYSPPDEVFTSCSPSLAPASDPAFPAPLGSPPAAYPIQPACLFSHHDFARILGGAAEPPHPRPPQGLPPYPQNLVSQFLARGPPVRPPSSPQEEQEGQSRTPSCMLNGYLGPHTRPTDRSGPTDGDAGKEIAAITPYQEETKVDLRHRRISQETRGQERGKTADINTDVSTSGAGMPLEQVATDLALPHRNSVRNQDGLHAVQPRREVELNGHSSASDSDNIHSEGPTTNRERLKRSAAAHSYTGSPQCRDRVDLEEVPLPGVESPSLQAHGVRVLSRSPQVGIHSSAEASPAVSSAGQRGEQPSASCRSQPSQLPSELGGMTETRGTRHSQLPGRLARDGYSFPQCNSTDKKEHPDTFPSLLASARHHAFSNPPSPSYREVPASAPPSAVSASAGLTPSTGPTQVGFRFASQEEMRGAAQSLPSGVVSSSRYQPVSGISTVDSGPAVTTTGALATATAFFSDQGTVSRTSPPAIVHPHRATNGIQGSLGSSEGGAAATCNFGEDQSRAFSFGNSGGGAGDGMSSREASVLQNRLEGQQKSAAVPGRMELTGQQRANSIDTGRSFLNGEQRSIRDLLVTRRSTNDAASWLAAQEVAPPQPTAPHHMSPSPARGVQLPSPDMALHRFPINSRTGCYPRSFRLFAWHERQQLLVRSPEELAKCLGCPRQSKAKVVAIFGNTGDGKSVLLNNLFFSGQPVFPLNPPASFAGSPSLSTAACDKTSWPVPVAYSKGPGGQEKGLCPPNFGAALRGPAGVVGESKVDRCSANQGHGTLVAGLGGTKDVWVAWWRAEPYSGCDDAIIMDTEGLLGVCEDEASRLRMLMVVLAVADICIVCKSSERLTVDLFQFLNAASNIYLQHLRPSLREALELQAVPAHPNGPACLIYHQLLYDKPLMTRTTLAAATTSDVCPSSFSHPTARGTAGQSVTASGGRQWDNSGHPGRSAHGLLGTGEDRHRGWLTVMDSSTFLELFNAAFSTALPPSSTPSASPFEAFSLVEYIGFSPCLTSSSSCTQQAQLPEQGNSIADSSSSPVEIEALSQRIRQLLHRSTAARPARPIAVIFGLLQYLVRQFGRHRVQLQRSFCGVPAGRTAGQRKLKRSDSKLQSARSGSRKHVNVSLSGASGAGGGEDTDANANETEADSIVIRWGSAPASLSAARGDDEEEENAVLLTQLCRRYYRDDGMESCVVCPAICLCCGRRCCLSMNHKGLPHCAAMRDDTAAAVAADLLRRIYGRATVGSVDGCQGPLESGGRGGGVGRMRPQSGGMVQNQPAGCRFRRELQNRRMLCRECWEQRGREEVVEWRSCAAADASSLKGMVMQMFSGAGVLECRVCGVIYMKREGVLKANPQTPIEAGKVIVQTHHCWSHVPLSAADTGDGKESGKSSNNEDDDRESTDSSGDEQQLSGRQHAAGPLFFSNGKFHFSSEGDECDVNGVSTFHSTRMNGRQSDHNGGGGDAEASMRWRLSYYKRLAPVIAQRQALGEGRRGLLPASGPSHPLRGTNGSADQYCDFGFPTSGYAVTRSARPSTGNCVTGYLRSGSSASFFGDTPAREGSFFGSSTVSAGSEDGPRPANVTDPRATAHDPLSVAGEWLAAGRDQFTASTGLPPSAAVASAAVAAAQTATTAVTSAAQKSIAGLPSHWTGQGPAFSRKQALSLLPAAFARRFYNEVDSTPPAVEASDSTRTAENSRNGRYKEELSHSETVCRSPQHASRAGVHRARDCAEMDSTPRAAIRVPPGILATRAGSRGLPEFGERSYHSSVNGDQTCYDNGPTSVPVRSFQADLPFRTSRRCSLAATDLDDTESCDRSGVRAESKADRFAERAERSSAPAVNGLRMLETDQCDEAPSIDNSVPISDFSWGRNTRAELSRVSGDARPPKTNDTRYEPDGSIELHARDQTVRQEDRDASAMITGREVADSGGVHTLSPGCSKKDLRVRIRIPLTVDERARRRQQLHGEQAQVKDRGRYGQDKSDNRGSEMELQNGHTRRVSPGFESSKLTEEYDCNPPPGQRSQTEDFSAAERTNMLLHECQNSPIPPPHEKLLLLQNAGHSFAFPQVTGNGPSPRGCSERTRYLPLRNMSGELLGGAVILTAAEKDARESRRDAGEENGSASNYAVGSLGSRTNSVGVPLESAKQQSLTAPSPASLNCDFGRDGSSVVALSSGPPQEEDSLCGELPSKERGDEEGAVTLGRGTGGSEYKLLVRRKTAKKTVQNTNHVAAPQEE